jgi:hypothetical protein
MTFITCRTTGARAIANGPTQVGALKQAGANEVAKKVENVAAMTAGLATAAGSATSDAANVAGTAGELFKRAAQGVFGVYTTKEGLAKAQVRVQAGGAAAPGDLSSYPETQAAGFASVLVGDAAPGRN